MSLELQRYIKSLKLIKFKTFQYLFHLYRTLQYKFNRKKVIIIFDDQYKGHLSVTKSGFFIRIVKKDHPRYFSYLNESMVYSKLQKIDSFPRFYKHISNHKLSIFVYSLFNYPLLSDLIKHKLFLSPIQYARISEELNKLLLLLQINKLIHRDIKPDNIFFSKNFDKLFLFDFQWSFFENSDIKLLNKEDSNTLKECLLKVGGKYRMPDLEAFTYSTDKYSVDKILIELEKLTSGSVGRVQRSSNSEIHSLIVWNKARFQTQMIENDINDYFSILKKYEITWGSQFFTSNLKRFYHKNLPSDSKKENYCGKGPFLLYVIKDKRPLYDLRKTSGGLRFVNVNVFDRKMVYRNLTRPDRSQNVNATIHASNNVEEAKRDLVLLTGKEYAFFKKIKNKAPPEKIEELNGDLIGAHGWNSLEQLFTVLNQSINYVVLRNFKNLFEEPINDDHGDIDILVDNYALACNLINSRPLFDQQFRVAQGVKVGNRTIHFDVRSIEDGYLDKNWAKKILKNRHFSSDGFFVPSSEDFFYSLLYHALVNKKKITGDYKFCLVNVGPNFGLNIEYDALENRLLTSRILVKYMLDNNYDLPEPFDLSVGYHSIPGINNNFSLCKRELRKYYCKLLNKLSIK